MIAKAIADYMKANKIKQVFICKRAGLTRYRLVRAFSGKRNLSIEEYEKICMALNVPYEFFFKMTCSV